MRQAKLKILATFAGLAIPIAQPRLQNPFEGLDWPQTIFLPTNLSENIRYPGCGCDLGALCDSCTAAVYLISCEGCAGTYFKDNPGRKTIELDGSWSPEGQVFELELKNVGDEESETQSQKVTVIRVPADCQFRDLIQKSFKSPISQDTNSDNSLSELTFGLYPDLVKKCGALNFGVQGSCVEISAQTDDSVTLAWEPEGDCYKAGGSTEVLLTISLQQYPRAKLDVDVSSLLFSDPLVDHAKMHSIISEYETVATSNGARNLGCGCTTSFVWTQPQSAGTQSFTYDECSGPYTYTLPPQTVNPSTCTYQMDYADWDIGGGCSGGGQDRNQSGDAYNKIPIDSSVTLYCKWAVVAPNGQSITIDSCSDATDPNYTGPQANQIAPKTTYTVNYEIGVYFPCSDKSRGNIISDSFTFTTGPKNVCKAAGSTTMIAPTLPPMDFNFAAGITQNPKGTIPAFSDTLGTAKCGTRTCTSVSPYAVWSQTDQQFTVGSTGFYTDVVGTHPVTLTCSLTCCPLITAASSSWDLIISASCYSTALVPPTVEANYNLYTGVTTAAATLIKWQDTYSLSTGTDGTGSDLCGARTCTSDSDYAVWASATQTITVKVPTGNTATGVFPVVISCSLSSYTQIPSQTINFTVTVSKCTFESIVATTSMSGLGSTPLVQTVLGASKSWTLDTLTSTALLNCQYTFTYHVQMKNTGSTDFTPFGGTLSAAVPPVLQVYTADPLAVNTYDLVWYVTSVENPAQTIFYVDFQVQIKVCAVESTTGAAYVALTRTQSIFDPVNSSTLSLRSQTPACGYTAVYSCQVKEVGTAVWSTASWCTVSSTNLLISSSDVTLDGKSFDVQQTTAFSSTYSESATVSSTVTFTDPCKTTAFITKTVPNQVYFITSEGLASPPFSFPWLDDSVNQSKGTSTTDSICYKSTVVITEAGAAPKYALLSPKNSGFDVTIATSDSTLAGYHTLIASYTFERYPLIPAVTISVVAKLYSIIAPKTADQVYTIKGSELKFTFDTFSALPASPSLTCVQKVTLSNDTPLPGFITVVKSDTSFVFSVLSGDDLNAGTYTIKIAAKFTEDSFSYETNSTFKVVVTSKTQKLRNQAPTFDAKLGGPFNLKVGENWSYKLPSYSDPEGQNVTLAVDLDLAGLFMTQQAGKLFFFTATTAFNIGTYPIKIKLTDSMGASTKYSFDLTVEDKIVADITNPALIQEQELNNVQHLAALDSSPEWNWLEQYLAAREKGQSLGRQPEPLRVRLSKISLLGEVQVHFSKPMVTPPLGIFRNISEPRNLTNATNSTYRSLLANQYQLASQYKTRAITVKSVQGEPANLADLDFEYNVTGYKNQTMTIQLGFVKADIVSQYREYDWMEIIFNGNFYFFDQEGQFVGKDTVIKHRLPSQLQYGTNETAAVVNLTAAAENTVVVLMSSNLLLNLLLSAALNQLVSMVRIMQIVVLIPLFNIRMPGNAALFFGFVMQIVSFDMIPMDDLYDKVFPNIQHQDDLLNPNFAQIGITQTHFLYNLGSLILAFVAIPFVLLLYPILIPCKKFSRVEDFRHKIWTWVFWSHTIATITESYVILVICVTINTLHMEFTSDGNLSNSILAIIFGAVLIVFPFITCIFVYKRFNNLEEPRIEASYGAFYEGLELRRGRSVVWELSMFFFRRILIPVVVVYQDHLIIQVMALSYTTVGQVIILGSVKPHQGGQKTYYMECFSECILMMIMYTMMMFTEFVPDLQTRGYIGYASMALVCFHLGVSFGEMMKDSFNRLVLRIKWYLIRRKNFKIHEAKIDEAVKAMISNAYRIDIIKEVDESLEESSRSRKSGRRSGRRKSTEKSPNQSMLRSEPDVIQSTPDALYRETLKLNSEDRLIEDHNYEADMTAIVKEVDQKNQSVLMDATVIDLVADIEVFQAETETEARHAEAQRKSEELRALEILPQNKATSIFIPDMKKISHLNQMLQKLKKK